MFVIRKAEVGDIASILQLLQDARLNQQGVDEHLHSFLVVEEQTDAGNQIVGSAGMEIHHEHGLLRSFVMKKAPWNGRVGLQLFGILLSWAEQRGIKELYLLAGVTQSFFLQIGFYPIKWEEIPKPVRASEHMRQTGMERRTPMRIRLETAIVEV